MTIFRRFYANNVPQQTLSSQINDTATSITVPSFAGWPTTFPLFGILDYGTNSEEIVLITGISGNVATITRGQEGSTAIAHPAGATVNHGAVARDFDDANAHINATTVVHGVAGAVVGTTDVQSLTNKTLISPVLSGTVNAGTVNATALTTSGDITVSGTAHGASAVLSGTLNVNGVTSTDDITTSQDMGVAGVFSGNSGSFSGALSVGSLTSGGSLHGSSVSGIIAPTSFTNQAAAGTGSPGQIVYLSAPTGAGVIPGDFIWNANSSSWQPLVVASTTVLGTLNGTYTGQPIKKFIGSIVAATDTNGDAIVLTNSQFAGIISAVGVGGSTFEVVESFRVVSSNLVARVWSGTTLAVSTSVTISVIIYGW